MMTTQKIDYYASNDKMYVASDCIVFGFDEGELKLLVFKRRVEPDKGNWSLIGSFLELDEDDDVASRRVLKQITGLNNVFLEQLKTYTRVDRDKGARCISIAKYALIRIDEHDKALVEKHGAYWYKLDELPELTLDHNDMVRDALDELKRKAKYQPIGFELLPEKFTIPQLQSLYEAIYQCRFDAGNFRKKVISLKVLEKLNEKDKTTSRRGAFLYRFNAKNYKKLVNSGYHFEI